MLDLRRDPRGVLKRSLAFLGIEEGGGGTEVGLESQNRFAMPRNLAALVVNRFLNRLLRRHALLARMADAVPSGFREVVRWLLFRPVAKPPRDPRAVEFLLSFYEKDVDRLEGILGCSLPDLRATWPRAQAQS